MTLYPLAIHNNLSPLGINPGFSPAPRLPWRCLPQLAVLLTLPDADTTESWPTLLGLAVLLPPLSLDATMAEMESCNDLSTVETLGTMPSPSVSMCP